MRLRDRERLGLREIETERDRERLGLREIETDRQREIGTERH